MSKTRTIIPNGFSIRRIELSDFEDVKIVLAGLTTVGPITLFTYETILNYWNSVKLMNKPTEYAYNTSVIIDDHTHTVAAIGTIFIEQKIIHDGGLVGHIEDIAVNSDYRGQKLGKLIIDYLSEQGEKLGCYKVILDCDVKNVGFYEKCNYNQAGIEMQTRF